MTALPGKGEFPVTPQHDKQELSLKKRCTTKHKYVSIENAFVFFLNKGLTSQSVFVILGNKRLQEMMEIMAKERGATLFATDERFKTFF